MYRMQNGVVYGPLSKITKLGAMPAFTEDSKERIETSGGREEGNQNIQNGIIKQVSSLKTPAAVSTAKQTSAIRTAIKQSLVAPSLAKKAPATPTPVKQVLAVPLSEEVNLLEEPVYKPRSQETKNISNKQLQEAILWSEILGKPICKRRKRSYYGD